LRLAMFLFLARVAFAPFVGFLIWFWLHRPFCFRLQPHRPTGAYNKKSDTIALRIALRISRLGRLRLAGWPCQPDYHG
jgi:hypothetical protein